MKKGFTLIEIVLVLIIISILIGVTLKFGSNRIVDLKSQNNKEQFISFYNDLYSSNLISNYHNVTRYEKLNIKIKIGSGISFFYDNPSSIRDNKFNSIIIQDINLNSGKIQDVNLQLKPYNIGCEIYGEKDSSVLTGDLLSFQVFSQDNKQKYCFEIGSDTCKLIEKKCNL